MASRVQAVISLGLFLILLSAPIDGGKFDTGLFENYDVTKSLFEGEVALVEKLKEMRSLLDQQRRELTKQLKIYLSCRIKPARLPSN